MRLPVTLALAALAIGCAPSRQGAARIRVRGLDSERPAATAVIPEVAVGAFLDRAAAVLREEGLRVAARTPVQLVTAPREVDLRCGLARCIARELAIVHVSGGAVRLELMRAVWDPSERAWSMALDRDTADATAAREARLLGAMLGALRAPVEISMR